MPVGLSSSLTVRVLLFASYADRLGLDSIALTLPAPATVGTVLERLRALPGGDLLPPRPLCARNLAHVVDCPQVADASHHLHAERDRSPLVLQASTQAAKLLHDRGDGVPPLASEEESRMDDHRLGTAREVANCVLFLAGDESTFITGSALVVDGGSTAR